MHFSELISFKKEYLKKRSDTLVILPFLTEYDYLSKHLELLSSQTCQDFDLLLVLNSISDEERVMGLVERTKRRFGVILAKRKENTGSAGGFFTGQKYAMEMGYQHMILTDADCLPIESTLIENLLKHRNKDFVSPHVRFTGDVPIKINRFGTNITYYSLISRTLVSEIGLYYAPLFYCADDMEYNERIARRPYIIESYCEHPFFGGESSFRKFDKYWLYLLHACMFSKDPRYLFTSLVNAVVTISVLLLFYPPYGKDTAFRLLDLLFTFRFGKPAVERLSIDLDDYIIEGSKIEKERSQYILYPDSNKPKNIAESLLFSIINFRKKIIIEKTNHIFKVVTMGAIFARTLYFKKDDNNYLLIAKQENALFHVFPLVALPILVLFLLFLALAIFIPIKLVKQPETKCYGLEP